MTLTGAANLPHLSAEAQVTPGRVLSVPSIGVVGITNTMTADYTDTVTTGSIVSGTVDTGNHYDDGTTAITLPFPYQFYGQTYTSGWVNSNGVLDFTAASATYSNTSLPTTGEPGGIYGYWSDLYTGDTASGQGVFTSISGTAPHRIFNVEWRATLCCSSGAPTIDYEVRLYEDSPRFDLIYGRADDQGSNETIGVQDANGTQATQLGQSHLNSL